MKNLKIILFATIFCGLTIGSTQAQSVKVKTVEMPIMFWDTESPELGVLTGTGTYHLLRHFDKNGTLIWVKANINKGVLVSSETGENFKSNSIGQYVPIASEPGWMAGWLKVVWLGDHGTRLVCYESFKFDRYGDEWISFVHKHKQW